MNEEFDEIDATVDSSVDFVYTGQAPVALLILCVSTFFGAAFILIKNAYLIREMSAVNDAIDYFNGVMNAYLIPNHPLGFHWPYLIEIVASLTAAFGAARLLKIKKIGYTIYVIGTVTYCTNFLVVVLIIYYLTGIMPLFYAFIYIAVPIAFLIMYSTFKRYLH
ncbi:MAG: hypothetical protein ACJA0U_000292 [Salibacteraceae bacterium]|jgi:hypothetical protein